MPTTKAYLKVSKHPDPSKPNSFLVNLYITVLSDEIEPAKHVIFMLDDNGLTDDNHIRNDRDIATVNLVAQHLFRNLEKDKDSVSVVQFHAKAMCSVPKQVITNSTGFSYYALGGATNLEAGLDGALDQIDKKDLDNTTIVLLLAGPLTIGINDPSVLIARLKSKLDGKTVRIVPIGIGKNYPVDLLKKLAEETGFKGLVHLAERNDTKNIIEQVKLYLLARSKPITASLTIEGSAAQCEELGSIEFNCSCSTVFEFTSAKPLKEVNLKGKVKIGDEEINVACPQQNEIQYDPEIIAKYYTQEYLKIVDEKISQAEKVIKLTQLRDQLNEVNLNQYQLIKDIHDTFVQTITSLNEHNPSAYRSITSSTYTHYLSSQRNRVRAPLLMKELVGIREYDKATQTVAVQENKYKVLTEDVDLNDPENNVPFIFFETDIHKREAILFNRQSSELKKSTETLLAHIKTLDSPRLPTLLNILCQFVRQNFIATDVANKVNEYERRGEYLYDADRFVANPNIPLVPLEFFKNTGVSRHYALFTAFALLQLIKAGLLPEGTVRIFRGTADEQQAHSWVIYHPASDVHNRLYLIDTTNPGQKVFTFKEHQEELDAAILNYRKRGLDGLLVQMLNAYNIDASDFAFNLGKRVDFNNLSIDMRYFEFSIDYQVSEELINKVQARIAAEKQASPNGISKTEQLLIQQGIMDHISLEIIVEPVTMEISDRNNIVEVYDRDFITAWLLQYNVSPQTGKKIYDKTLSPAYDEVKRINGVLANILELSPPTEANGLVIIQPLVQPTEEERLQRLNAKDIKIGKAVLRHASLRGFRNIYGAIASASSSSSSTAATVGALSSAASAVLVSVVTTEDMSLTPISLSTPAAGQSASAPQTPMWVPPPDVLGNNGSSMNQSSDLHLAQSDQNDHWFNKTPMYIILSTYKFRRGFKFFGYSSDDSLELCKKLLNPKYSKVDVTIAVDAYLANEDNKGKRLYDILIEEKIKAKKSSQQEIANIANNIWLDEDVLYLIQQNYKLKRGFKIFGKSSDESLTLLKILNGTIDISVKQRALDDYLRLHQDEEKPKRLYKILIELKTMCLPAAPHDVCHSRPEKS